MRFVNELYETSTPAGRVELGMLCLFNNILAIRSRFQHQRLVTLIAGSVKAGIYAGHVAKA